MKRISQYRGQIKKSGYMYKMVLLFLVIIITSSLILSVFAYKNYSGVLTNKLYSEQQQSLERNRGTWTYFQKEINQLYSSIIVESSTDLFFSLREFDPAQHYHTFLKVRKLYGINTMIDSVCLYNDKIDDTIFCGSDSINLEDIWKNIRVNKGYTLVRSRSTDRGNRPVLLFGYPVYTDTYENPDGAVIFSVDSTKLMEQVIGEREDSWLLLMDNKIILGDENVDPEILKWAVSDRVTDKILKTEGRSYLCSVSSDKKFTYVNYVDLKTVMGPLYRQRNFFLLVCMVVTAICALVQTAALKIAYRPIKSIKDIFSRSKYAESSDGNEFDMIRQVYEHAMEEINQLETEKASIQNRKRMEYLAQLFNGNMLITDFDYNFEGMFLAYILFEKPKDQSLINQLVQANIAVKIKEILNRSFVTETIPVSDRELLCLIGNGNNQEVTFEELVCSIEEVKNQIENTFGIEAITAVDGIINSREDCPVVYNRVKELAKNRFSLGNNSVITPGAIQTLLPEPINFPDKLVNEITSCMKMGKRSLFIEKVEDFLDVISGYRYASASLMFARLYIELVMTIQKESTSSSGGALSAEMTMNPSARNEARQLLYDLYDISEKYKSENEEVRNSKHYGKICESKEYILSHYGDSMLNVDQIAEAFGYSGNYFGRMFKSTTGYFINDYIRQIRVGKAQEMLETTALSVQEISERTGFTTINYFYTIFKKETGLTPAAYRNSKRKREQ